MKFQKTIIAAALLTLVPLAQAATVDVTWGDTKEFADIRPTDGGKTRFATRVKDELTEQFQKEAAKLPEGQKLVVEVKDLNLAGDIEYFHYGYENGLRVIRSVDFPSMELSYELRDASDRVIKSGEESFKDLGFNANILTKYDRSSALSYEKAMITKWYQESL